MATSYSIFYPLLPWSEFHSQASQNQSRSTFEAGP